MQGDVLVGHVGAADGLGILGQRHGLRFAVHGLGKAEGVVAEVEGNRSCGSRNEKASPAVGHREVEGDLVLADLVPVAVEVALLEAGGKAGFLEDGGGVRLGDRLGGTRNQSGEENEAKRNP